MSGEDLNLPPHVVQQVMQRERSAVNGQMLFMQVAASLHKTFVEKCCVAELQDRVLDAGEEWKGNKGGKGSPPPEELARRAVAHARALMGALGFEVEKADD